MLTNQNKLIRVELDSVSVTIHLKRSLLDNYTLPSIIKCLYEYEGELDIREYFIGTSIHSTKGRIGNILPTNL